MVVFVKKNMSNLLLCLGELVVGVLLLINPQGFTAGILIALGIALAVLGVFSVVRYFRSDPVLAASERRLAYGLGELALGLFFMLKTNSLVSLFPALVRLYGVGVLVLGLFRIQQFADVRRLHLGSGLITGVSAVITVVYASMVLFMPEITWIFVGVAMLLEAVMDILILIFERKQA